MRLLKVDDTDDLRLVTFNESVDQETGTLRPVTADDSHLRYAILSHRWLADEEEVTYDDVVSRRDVTSKRGWQKLQWLRRQALADGHAYAWSDTCCIDKSSSQELSESIISMYRWYQSAQCCYVYLHDMPDPVAAGGELEPKQTLSAITVEASTYAEDSLGILQDSVAGLQRYHDISVHQSTTGATSNEAVTDQPTCKHSEIQRISPEGIEWNALKKCEWFTRGWTLQEMIAPPAVRFYSSTWKLLGNLFDAAEEISKITGVPSKLLNKTRLISTYSIAQKFSWAAKRRTKRLEDRSYSLLGLLDINIGIVYGEGHRAFQRLQEELLRASVDDSIFVFKDLDSAGGPVLPLLAESMDQFEGSSNIAFQPDSALRLGRHCQVLSRQVTFHRYRLICDMKKGQEVYHAILSCWDETDFSKLITLSLSRQTKNVFKVSPRSSRIARLDAYVSLHNTLVEAFSVGMEVSSNNRDHKDPLKRRYRGAETQVVVCRFTPRISLTGDFCLLRPSLRHRLKTNVVDWQAGKQILIVHPARDCVKGYFMLHLSGNEASTVAQQAHDPLLPTFQSSNLKLRLTYNDPGPHYWSYPKIGRHTLWRWEFVDASWTLPTFATLVLASGAYQCTMKWHKGGLVVVRFFRQPGLNNDHSNRQCLLTVEHLDLLRSVVYLGLTVLLGLASCSLFFIFYFAGLPIAAVWGLWNIWKILESFVSHLYIMAADVVSNSRHEFE